MPYPNNIVQFRTVLSVFEQLLIGNLAESLFQLTGAGMPDLAQQSLKRSESETLFGKIG
jgi:hypothetical protein